MKHLDTLARALAPRLAPFLDLLDARYLPLLAVVAPQAWTVYAWLLGDGAPEAVATMGGIGYEAVYVGAVAWAERGAGWRAARLPAVTALVFSVAVAVAYYGERLGPLAVLHAGFPLVAYAYTVMMHTPHAGAPVAPSWWQRIIIRVFGGVEVKHAASALQAAERPALQADAVTLQAGAVAVSPTARIKELARQAGVSESTMRRRVERGEVTL